jgi:transposase-like protein
MEYKKYSTELKEKVISSYLSGGKSIRELAGEYQISPSTVNSWIQRSKAFTQDNGTHALVDVSELIHTMQEAPEKALCGSITFRMNAFEFELDIHQLGALYIVPFHR